MVSMGVSMFQWLQHPTMSQHIPLSHISPRPNVFNVSAHPNYSPYSTMSHHLPIPHHEPPQRNISNVPPFPTYSTSHRISKTPHVPPSPTSHHVPMTSHTLPHPTTSQHLQCRTASHLHPYPTISPHPQAMTAPR